LFINELKRIYFSLASHNYDGFKDSATSVGNAQPSSTTGEVANEYIFEG
jgi:hypothetical protein